MAVFTAYFDASGNKRSPVLTFAGFVSRVSKWNRFEKEWPELLKRYGVSTLHMTEFVSGKGEFKDWKGDSIKRKKFIEDAVSCVKRNTNKGFATSVFMSEYDEVNSRFRVAETAGPPYAMCGMMAIAQVSRWAENKNIDPTKVLYMIEDGDDDKGELIERAKLTGHRVIPMTKEECVAFQAGDMVAWKAMNILRNAEKKFADPNKCPDDFINLIRSLDPIAPILTKNGVMRKSRLESMCAENKIKPRNAMIKA